MEAESLAFATWSAAAAALLVLFFVGWRCQRWLSNRRAGRAAASDALAIDAGHRVASTLQMILSLLRMHERRVRNNRENPDAAAAALRAAEERIATVAIVHRELHQVAEAGAADMERLLWMVVDTLIVSGNIDHHVDVKVSCDGVSLPSQQAIPLAVIVGEWTTRRLRRRPEPTAIRIALRAEEGQQVLEYGDDGPAWDPALDDDILHAQVVSAMVRQLSGSLVHAPGPAVYLRLAFPPAPASSPEEG